MRNALIGADSGKSQEILCCRKLYRTRTLLADRCDAANGCREVAFSDAKDAVITLGNYALIFRKGSVNKLGR